MTTAIPNPAKPQGLPKALSDGNRDRPPNGPPSGVANRDGRKPKVDQGSPKSPTPKSPKGGKITPWNFPKNSLEDAIKIAQAIEEKNAGKSIDAPTLAKYTGYNKANDWRFLNLLQSANLYNLVKGSGQKATVSLERIGEDIISPSSPEQRQKSLAQAFDSVELFKQVAEYYKGKTISEDEYFANTLVRDFHVPRDRIELFISVFKANLTYLKAFAVSSDGRPTVKAYGGIGERNDAAGEATSTSEPKESNIRQFLDTCFVLMPFGGWYDKYYEQIYKSAIKDAGFEPFRGDDLFHTGSVVEQLWEQVQKAKVLLAELTGKNANVFYELGLSHAKGKPVVFVAGNIDDVPFDLRHLRVIVYDVREPDWGNKLRSDIAIYLRNAKADPTKSIPAPFRATSGNDDEGHQ